MGAVSVYISQDQLASFKQQPGKHIEINTESIQSGSGVVSVTITLTGTGDHEIEIKPFNAKASFSSKKISLSGNRSEKIQLELTVAELDKPYVAVISVNKNPGLRKEIVGSYVNASLTAGR